MKEDNKITNWWEKEDDDLNVNEEVSEQVEETTEETIEDVEDTQEDEEEVEEVAEDVSVSSGDYEVYGTDKELVNHVSALINDLGKSVTVVDNHADLKGGNTIILCGDDWSAFCSAAKVNEANQSLVVQFEHDHHHEQGGHGFSTGAHNIRYTLGENKAKVAKRVAPRL